MGGTLGAADIGRSYVKSKSIGVRLYKPSRFLSGMMGTEKRRPLLQLTTVIVSGTQYGIQQF
jgi:hypothetical protein